VKFFTKSLNSTISVDAKTRLNLPFQLVKPHLRVIEREITTQAEAFDPEVAPYVMYATQSKGKRLRPALALLAGGATGEIDRRHLDLAVILELIHMATLIHDDILDGALKRRDKPTPNAKWGNTVTVLLGDALFSHALRLSTNFDEAAICRKIAAATSDVCSGEILQTRKRFDWNLSLEDYHKIIELKTARLFMVAAEVAAELNGASPEKVEACLQYGRKLGIAYQIYDDCLDLAGAEENAGKTLGTDLKRGKVTLPVLKLLEASNDMEHAEICEHMASGDGERHNIVNRLVLDGGHLDAAARDTASMVREAQDELRVLPESDYREGMHVIGDTLLSMLGRLTSVPSA
jgi:octaprenyl-diphosphate synthase